MQQTFSHFSRYKFDLPTIIKPSRNLPSMAALAAMNSSQPCHFLQIPPEVRTLIYQLLFNKTTLYVQNGDIWTTGDKALGHLHSTQLVRTCRTIRKEATEALYSQVTIHFLLRRKDNPANLNTVLQSYYIPFVPRLIIRSRIVDTPDEVSEQWVTTKHSMPNAHDMLMDNTRHFDEGMNPFELFSAVKTLTLANRAGQAFFIAYMDLHECEAELHISRASANDGFSGAVVRANFEEALKEHRVSNIPLIKSVLCEVLQAPSRTF